MVRLFPTFWGKGGGGISLKRDNSPKPASKTRNHSGEGEPHALKRGEKQFSRLCQKDCVHIKIGGEKKAVTKTKKGPTWRDGRKAASVRQK